MDQWEAKYKFLAMGLDDPKYIENAEKACRACMAMAQSTPYTFEQCVCAFMDLMSAEMLKDTIEIGDRDAFHQG